MINMAPKTHAIYFRPPLTSSTEKNHSRLVPHLLEKVQLEHLKLQRLISIAKDVICQDNSSTLKLFLDEVEAKLCLLAISFDEFLMQFFSLAGKEKLEPLDLSQDLRGYDHLKLMDDMLGATSQLYHCMLFFEAELKKDKPRMLFQDLVRKSLVFYRQTNIVLKGYLRIYKG